ncbi:MAG: MFS transporter [Steroidobacteraceae bacterium]|nr:MFS transporter [Steroidobacteraceae bacterium]
MKPLLTLFLIVFVDLLGFGIIIPLFPFVAERMGADPWLITFGGAGIYSLAQVIAAPLWGRASDAFGRRPVLFVSMLGAVAGYVWLGLAGSLAMLIASRALSGMMAGNISAAFAYVADVTTPENRAKGLGMIGAAFGLGFMFGPVIGGLLGGTDPEAMNFTLPALVAAGLSALAALGTWLFLPESLKPEDRKSWAASVAPRRAPQPGDGAAGNALRGLRSMLLSPFAAVAHSPVLRAVITAVFLIGVCGTILQSIVPVWGAAVLGLTPRDVGFVFFAMGVVGVTVQGGLVGPLVRRLGEKKVLYLSALAHAIGFVTLALASDRAALLVGALAFSAGHATFNTTASSLVSLEAEPRGKGAALGAMQSASAAGRIVGPASSGAIYSGVSATAPFIAAALLLLPVVWLLRRSHAGDRPHE